MRESKAAREVLLRDPELSVEQMLRVERGQESVPLEWPSNWQYLLLINKIVDMVESNELQNEQWLKDAAKARVLFDRGDAYSK